MLSPKQAENFSMACAKWLEKYLKSRAFTLIDDVYSAGKTEGFSKPQIKAARAWHGKWITTATNSHGVLWGWDLQ
jgi:hypothetical protein